MLSFISANGQCVCIIGACQTCQVKSKVKSWLLLFPVHCATRACAVPMCVVTPPIGGFALSTKDVFLSPPVSSRKAKINFYTPIWKNGRIIPWQCPSVYPSVQLPWYSNTSLQSGTNSSTTRKPSQISSMTTLMKLDVPLLVHSLLYPPLNKVVGGYIGFTSSVCPSICLSVRLSVRPASAL